jgi:hypothetical protein
MYIYIYTYIVCCFNGFVSCKSGSTPVNGNCQVQSAGCGGGAFVGGYVLLLLLLLLLLFFVVVMCCQERERERGAGVHFNFIDNCRYLLGCARPGAITCSVVAPRPILHQGYVITGCCCRCCCCCCFLKFCKCLHLLKSLRCRYS